MSLKKVAHNKGTKLSEARRRASANKRTAAQVMADRHYIANCRIQGWTLARITAGLNEERKGIYRLSLSAVYADLKVVEAEWLEATKADMAEWKAKELAGLQRMEDEAWQAWLSSKKERRRASIETLDLGQGTTAQSRRKANVTTEANDGDPRFLDIVLKLQDRRAKLLGLNAAIVVANPDGTPLAPMAGLTPIINILIAPPPEGETDGL